MKRNLLLLFALVASVSFGQINVHVSGNIFNAKSDSVHIAQYFRTGYVNHISGVFNDDGTFDLKGQLDVQDYYVLRIGNEFVNLILRDGSDIKVYGDGNSLRSFVNIVGSDESSNMYKYLQLAQQWQIKLDSANRAVSADPSIRDEINKEMSNAYQQFQGDTKAFIARNANSAALYAAVSAIDPQQDFQTYESVIKQLERAFGDSPSVQGLVKNFDRIKQEQLANDKLAPGKEAPDFEEKLADGSTMKLSDLRGKVVLLDFWASWCRPCRAENPNVVKLYEQYKDKGFTVMSVSLDKTKEPWLAAIEKDGLAWPNHVSDLKGWNCAAAKVYGVTGIPFTVLIDQEGKIIRTKLRGHELASELARIFGS